MSVISARICARFECVKKKITLTERPNKNIHETLSSESLVFHVAREICDLFVEINW